MLDFLIKNHSCHFRIKNEDLSKIKENHLNYGMIQIEKLKNHSIMMISDTNLFKNFILNSKAEIFPD